jgi:hypothetical protein
VACIYLVCAMMQGSRFLSEESTMKCQEFCKVSNNRSLWQVGLDRARL